MIKRVKVYKLRPGMYVHDFNCDWKIHPSFSHIRKIKDLETIAEIIDFGMREIYIDTEKGLDAPDAPTEEEVRFRLEKDIISSFGNQKIRNTNKVPFDEEIQNAREIQKEASETVKGLMDDIRLGRQFKIEKVHHVVDRMVNSIFLNKDAMISLGRIKTADTYTFYHSISVGVLMISFARHLGLDQETIKAVGVGGLMHDMGKVMVPFRILTKPDRLTDREYLTMKEHVVHSRSIVEKINGISEKSVHVAAQHHERFDGNGYPLGLKKDEISLFGHMSAIVDVYDAISSDRCYHNGMLPTRALRKLYEWSQYHFHPKLVEQFIQCMGIYPVGTLVRLESGFLGVVLDSGEKGLLYPNVRVVYDLKKKMRITPYDLDLSLKMDERIESYESPARWKINPEEFLMHEMAF